MSTKNIIIAVLAVSLVLFYLYQAGYIFANFKSLTAVEADEMLKNDKGNVVVLDVRTADEYKFDGKLSGSILIPVQSLSSELSKLQSHKGKKILVYCRSGSRSVMASRILTSAGFEAYNMRGGINGWKSADLPVVK